jgi:hypothetical protein
MNAEIALSRAASAAAAVRTYARQAGSRRWLRAHLFRKQIAFGKLPQNNEIHPHVIGGAIAQRACG